MNCPSHSLETLVSQLSLEITRYQHPPLHDCQEADRLALVRSGQRTKSLFLRDNYGKRHFLLITRHDKAVDLKALSRQQGVARLGFASAERLSRFLAVAPGHVSLLALNNDPSREVECWIDEALWTGEGLQCHPLDNQHTWVLSADAVRSLFQHWQRPLVCLAVPSL
ncbi:prolyl-tRNA synthetase associated domain-containing protein [Ferrimonas marina]|uniref:Ala-tRNA(Pro) deacylase n=1 Tax=Ferrimonas marina TaxID=299255 RepID=A0A1M5VQR5_9GAMM|nr:YbaK/EbsC family protein [Ferrimonas marina]SHH77273.1 Ala-tRNA(Pro) deacylase [Ferrimonas marina]